MKQLFNRVRAAAIQQGLWRKSEADYQKEMHHNVAEIRKKNNEEISTWISCDATGGEKILSDYALLSNRAKVLSQQMEAMNACSPGYGITCNEWQRVMQEMSQLSDRYSEQMEIEKKALRA